MIPFLFLSTSQQALFKVKGKNNLLSSSGLLKYCSKHKPEITELSGQDVTDIWIGSLPF